MNSLAHIEINVSNLKKSKDFYESILLQLGWGKTSEDKKSIGFKGKDNTHLFLVQTDSLFKLNIFHRKQIGLNHIAFRTKSKKEVESFSKFLKSKDIKILYSNEPKDYSKEYDMKEYFAIFFEDPDRIKLEVAFIK